MKVLVVGRGGREHALVRALHRSPSVKEVFAAPGSDGMVGEATCLDGSLSSPEPLLEFSRQHRIDLVVIGPEVPLAQGLADFLRSEGIDVFGPSKAAARLEASKIFSKQFMERAKVPTSAYQVVETVEQTLLAAKKFSPPYILKADGLAAGKGVFICSTLEELEKSAQDLFIKKILGDAGHRALVEEFLPGWELSFLILTNGKEYVPLPLSQDHKRLGQGDTGPNTGGMGVVAPLRISPELYQQIETKILQPSVAQLNKEELLYRGVLYVGVMVTEQGPMVLEYNVRFGDPEAQVILPMLDGDWGLVMKHLAEGELDPLKWKDIYTACIVLAAEGYPDQPKLGVEIEGDLTARAESSYFLHAGVGKKIEKGSPLGKWVTQGGRVLNSVAWGSSLKGALDMAYRQAEQAQWPGRQMRRDIGQKILIQENGGEKK